MVVKFLLFAVLFAGCNAHLLFRTEPGDLMPGRNEKVVLALPPFAAGGGGVIPTAVLQTTSGDVSVRFWGSHTYNPDCDGVDLGELVGSGRLTSPLEGTGDKLGTMERTYYPYWCARIQNLRPDEPSKYVLQFNTGDSVLRTDLPDFAVDVLNNEVAPSAQEIHLVGTSPGSPDALLDYTVTAYHGPLSVAFEYPLGGSSPTCDGIVPSQRYEISRSGDSTISVNNVQGPLCVFVRNESSSHFRRYDIETNSQ